MRKYTLTPVPADDLFSVIEQHLHSKAAALVYWQKQLRSLEQIESFTGSAKIDETIDLFDCKSAWKLLEQHIATQSKIAVYGDYDADGAVAAAILWRFLARVLKLDATVYIPDRHEEGYGLNKQALLSLAAQGYALVISVDCGVRDRDLIKAVTSETELDIIVTDHHQPGDTFPECPTVHPLFPENVSANKYTSGGVVAWKFVRYIESQLKLGHEYSDSVVDLAGISLITDIMPLLGENRALVKLALRKIRVNPTLGIKALLDVTLVPQQEVSTYHLGYVIGPRLNASGRIGNPYASTRLLCTDSEAKASEIALEVNDINIKRQVLTKETVAQAEKVKKVINNQLIIAAGEGWDDGIIGLVAGRLMNTYDMPTLAITTDAEKGTAKGSARSFGEFNITGLLESVKSELARYGGHSNAAGFSIDSASIDKLVSAIEAELLSKHSDYIPTLIKNVDAIVQLQDLSDEFFEALSKLEPFGPENWQPNFVLEGTVVQFNTVGKMGNHVRIEVQTPTGIIKAMYFDAIDKMQKIEQGQEITLVGKPKKESYNGAMQITFMVDNILEPGDLAR
jgi:single-stranded-DNA-specific exonuclease